jgi:DNA-binding protein HU-beta
MKLFLEAAARRAWATRGLRGVPAKQETTRACVARAGERLSWGCVQQDKEKCGMAIKKAKKGDKALTKTAIIGCMAEETGLTKKDVTKVLDTLTALIYAQAPAGFTVPGLGKVKLVERPERMGRNPRTGEPVKIPKKTVLKFSFAKAAKDAIVPPKKK